MSTVITFNGSTYVIPATGDTGWGNNVSSYLIALAAGTLQKTGGSFTLSNEVDFGGAFGIKSLYYKSESPDIATAGVIRLANTDLIAWRDGANGDNNYLAMNSTSTGGVTYTLPDVGSTSASFVMTAGDQTIAGIKHFTSSLIASNAHNAFGIGAALANIGVRFTSSFTSPGGLGGFVAGLDIDPTITGGPGDTAYQNYVNIAGFGITTQPSETVGNVESLRIADPQITVGAGGTVSVASLLYLDVAPTEGVTNAAIYMSSGVMLTPNGSVTAPVFAPISEKNTGIYYPATGSLAVSGTGTKIFEVDTTSAYFLNGTENSPSLTFISDDNTGMFRVAANSIGFTTDGTKRVQIDNSSLSVFATSDQLVLGSGNNVVISAPTPATTSRRWTIPDISSAATFAALEGTQTFSGSKTFSSNILTTSSIGLVLTDNTSNTVRVKATDSTTSYVLSLPTTAGSSNQYLTTDGSGNTSWTNAAGSGTVNTGVANTLAYYVTSTNAVSNLAAITASRALVSDSNGLPVASSVTSTTLAFLDATSSVQTQINTKADNSLNYVTIGNTGSLSAERALTGTTNQIIITDNGANSTVVLSTPQNINTSATPTFASETLSATTNQLVLGTTNTVTITSPAPASSRTLTIPDPGTASANFVLSEGTATINGTKTFAGQLIGKGTATNDNAASGYIGEYIESVIGSTSMPATGTYGEVTSISLTAGDWDVTGVIDFESNGATYTTVDLEGLIGTATGDNITGAVQGSSYFLLVPSGSAAWVSFAMAIPNVRKSITATTTYYLKVFPGSYSAGTPKVRGRISARRMR